MSCERQLTLQAWQSQKEEVQSETARETSARRFRVLEEAQHVGGSFSARVPRSSAEVHREFVHHILEDEVDGQKERQGDQREDDEEGEVNGVVEEIRETQQQCA